MVTSSDQHGVSSELDILSNGSMYGVTHGVVVVSSVQVGSQEGPKWVTQRVHFRVPTLEMTYFTC